MPAVDSHCHLDAMGCRDADDVARVVSQATSVGITRLVTSGDNVDSSRWCAEVAATDPAVIATVAVHPNETNNLTDSSYDEISRLGALPQVRAIGETGLDYYWDRVDAATQQEAFRRHIAIAKDLGKALVIHDRDAHEDILRILDEEGAPEHTVFHCFSGDAEMAKRCVDQGYVLSFAGTVTFRNAPELREAVRLVPPSQLLVETDAPFLTPMPYRGRPNGPYLVPLTIRCIAEVTDRPVAAVCLAVAETATTVFGHW